jgi:hypothetical protein
MARWIIGTTTRHRATRGQACSADHDRGHAIFKEIVHRYFSQINGRPQCRSQHNDLFFSLFLPLTQNYEFIPIHLK